jgi:hypothetical protein
MPRSAAPSPIAIDASALVELLLDTPSGRRIAQKVAGAQLIAPDIINPEIMQSLRGLERAGKVSGKRAATALARLIHSPIARVPTTGLLAEAWSLRFNPVGIRRLLRSARTDAWLSAPEHRRSSAPCAVARRHVPVMAPRRRSPLP